jgi:hypothetical protein
LALFAIQPLATNLAFVAMAIAALALALEGHRAVRAPLVASAVASLLMAFSAGGPDGAPMLVILEVSGLMVGLLWMLAATTELSSEQNEASIIVAPS